VVPIFKYNSSSCALERLSAVVGFIEFYYDLIVINPKITLLLLTLLLLTYNRALPLPHGDLSTPEDRSTLFYGHFILRPHAPCLPATITVAIHKSLVSLPAYNKFFLSLYFDRLLRLLP
jgi:hypothetical protein